MTCASVDSVAYYFFMYQIFLQFSNFRNVLNNEQITVKRYKANHFYRAIQNSNHRVNEDTSEHQFMRKMI